MVLRRWAAVAATSLIAGSISAVPVSATEGERATTVIQGQWFNGTGTTSCDGPLSALKCDHSADSNEPYLGASVCFEAVGGTGVGSLGCSAGLSGTSVGIGRKDLTCATRPANPLTTNGTASYSSSTLGQSFSIPVKIYTDNGTTYFHGVGNFPLGTASIEGTYQAGCDVEGVLHRGPFTGTFTIAIAL